MNRNKEYYLEQLGRARAEAADRLSEGGPDFLHVVSDALEHLEGAIGEGFRPWEDYDGGEHCYRFELEGSAVITDIWENSIDEALQVFRKSLPHSGIKLITRVK